MQKLLQQLRRFVSVGVVTTALHALCALLFNGAGLVPLTANFAAFLVATSFSYTCNALWTFESAATHRSAVPKYLAVTLSGFAVNQAIVWWVTVHNRLPLWLAMCVMVCVIPPFSFVLSRSYVFTRSRA